jgi:outer membrane cobalamin receptor
MYSGNMKTHPATNGGLVRMIFCLTVAGACLITGLANADGVKSESATPKSEKKKDGKEAKVMVTGSNIPQKADRVGRTPTTASPVVILDRRDIERTGRPTAIGVLSRQATIR